MLNGEDSREKANKRLERELAKVTNKNERREVCREIYARFNIPIELSSDVITFRKDVRELSNFVVFCFLFVLENECLGLYFTKKEIEVLSEEKWEQKKIEFPLIFDGMVQIADDQWIGRTSLQTLMKFKDAQLINYDENEQRTFRRVKNGDTEVFKIFINKKNVDEIKQLLESGLYIPDDITLNMPLGSEFEYSNYSMRIDSLPNGKFNIIDGYHRWLSMSQIYNFDRQFDYPMELRIVNYPTEKAEQLIFQKDQKTVMKKADSNTYNQYSSANKIVQRLNQDPASYIQGCIGRNNAIINMQSLVSLVNYFYCRSSKTQDIAFIIETKNKLQSKFNSLIESDTQLLKEKWSEKELFVIMYLFHKDIKPTKELIERLSASIDVHTGLFYQGKTYPRRKIINMLDKAITSDRAVAPDDAAGGV